MNYKEKKYAREKVKYLSLEQKNELIIKLYLDDLTLKTISAIFEFDIQYIVQILEEVDIKKCKKCKKILSRKEFNKKETTDGLNHRCKSCTSNYRKNYYYKNREENIKKSVEWKRNNPERVAELRKIKNQKPENKLKNAKYIYNRRHTDPKFRLRMNFSNLITYSLKNYSKVKTKQGYSWEEILDYSLDDLVKHLETNFQPGMTWDNYGDWHIDHIVPQSLFEFESTDDYLFHACWSLKNLQPLWAKDNLKKSNKVIV